MIGGLVFWQGMVFILIMIIYFTFLIINNRLTDSEQNVHEDNNRFFLVIQLIIGIIGLGFGASFFIEGAKGIAIYLGVSDLVIGMSIVALGTSLPELAASLSSIKHGESGLIIGNVIGSNIMNIILVLGITLFFGNIHIVFSEIIIYGFFMLLFTISLLILLKMKNKINKFSGFVFIMIYILFLYLNFSNI
jgi:cation:H+ antiporter